MRQKIRNQIVVYEKFAVDSEVQVRALNLPYNRKGGWNLFIFLRIIKFIIYCCLCKIG